MLKVKSVLVVLIITVLLLFGTNCTSPRNLAVNLGEEFTLSIGQTASIQGESLKLKFVEVIGDSRCPSGVECFWQGEVNCRLEITYGDSSNTKILTQPGLYVEPSVTDFVDYRLQFDVQPYPEEGEKIKVGDYRLNMVVDKK